MPYESIRGRLQARPFTPFSVVTSSGDRYEIRHPEMAVATKSELAIALVGRNGIPTRLQLLSNLHITALEPLDTQTAS